MRCPAGAVHGAICPSFASTEDAVALHVGCRLLACGDARQLVLVVAGAALGQSCGIIASSGRVRVQAYCP
jgi:hypothetical protein